jgi:hypothetical protein
MTSIRELSNHPFSSSSSSVPPFHESTSADLQPAGIAPTGYGRQSRQAGWRRLATGLRGVRLYAIKPSGGDAYWFAEVMRDGGPVSRRFASELHARAWLLELVRPVDTSFSVDWEELNGPLRTSGMVRPVRST